MKIQQNAQPAVEYILSHIPNTTAVAIFVEAFVTCYLSLVLYGSLQL